LISSANDGVPTSEFIVAADTFKIGAPVEGNVSDAAFAVYTEETVVGGITYPAGTYVNGFLNAENINVGTLNANRIQLDSAAFETDVDGNLIIVASGLPADQLKLGGEFKYNVTSKALEVNALSADSITSGTISTSLLDIDGTTLAIDGVTSALVVGTIDGAGNITPGSITAASIDAATITTDKLVLGSGTTLVDDGEGGLIVGTINGVDNITPGSITADSIAANTITAGLINLGDTSLASDGSGGLVVGTFDGDDHINSGTISAGLLRLGNTTLGDDGSGQLVVGQIDGEGNITPGSITAGSVAANAITAAKMRIGDFMNYAENADFELGDTAWNTGSAGFTIEADSNFYAGAYSLRRTTTLGNTGFCVNDFQFSAAPGDQFNVSAYVKVSATYGGGGVGVGIRWFQSDGTLISTQQSNITATTAWQKVEANLTAPALAAYGVGQCRNVSQTAGTAYWDNFTLLKKQSGAALIVNGTIQADQVDANFIDAFSINADNITTGSISADRLSIDGVTLDTDGAGNLIVGDGGISTIKVADRAITSQTSVFDGGSVFTSTSFIDIASISFSSPGDQQVLMGYDFSILAESTAASGTITYYELYINGVLSGSGSVSGTGGAGMAASRAISVSSRTTVAGTNTILVRGKRGGTASVSNSYNAILGVSLFTLEALK
jgi:hypothetical protein